MNRPFPLADIAERKWLTFCETANDHTIDLLEKKHLQEETRRIFAFSEFVADNCTRSPDLLEELILSGDLEGGYSAGHYLDIIRERLREAPDGAAFGAALCRIRRREMIRIAWRDLARRADLPETLEELSAFADAVLRGTLEVLFKKFCREYGTPVSNGGDPQHLVVIGMGKLGAGELNFSSDIDLVFCYPQAGNTTGQDSPITNEEFFVRLCRKYVNILGSKTADGPLFRVDLRLRPYGENGPLVMSFDNMEDYYQNQGREWERYAWIKARVVAGDAADGRILLDAMKPFIYRRYIDYNMFESFREMKLKIERELKTRGIRENIKNGPGGIREVEFFGQIFQLLRGGVMPGLQKRPISVVLQALSRETYISVDLAGRLIAGYEFLRNTENRLQAYADQQTHVLPGDDDGRRRLAASMGFDNWQAFKKTLDEHRGIIHEQFRLLLTMDDDDGGHLTGTNEKEIDTVLENIWMGLEDEGTAMDTLSEMGCRCPGELIRALSVLRQDSATQALGQEGRRRLNRLIPVLIGKFIAAKHPPKVLQDILDLIRTVQGRTTYLSLLVENPDAVSRLLEFSAASPWLVSYLSRHPVLLDELLDPRTLYTPPTPDELAGDLQRRLKNIDNEDLEYQMEALRIFKHANTLRVAAADISGGLPLMEVSDHLSWIAGEVINKVLDLSWEHLIRKHGMPVCELGGKKLQRGFAVIAYGKLGGFELGYTSDLDLVFLHAGTGAETIGGDRPTDTGQFFARLGQRVIHLMTAHTGAGVLYETDTRLRPSGSGGILVSHIDSFESYQLNEAWPWEHQALVRARAIWGDPALRERFEQIRVKAIRLHRDKKILQKEVTDMRMRMFREHGSRHPDTFDLKQDRGGMVDIEFLVQYIVLLMAREHAPLTAWTDNVRLIQSLAQCGLINDRTAHLLRAAYLAYRSLAHRLSLQDKPPLVPENTFLSLRQSISDQWNRTFGLR